MIVPLIAKTIAEMPMASNKVLWQILEPFGKQYCFTVAIILGARKEARQLIFGGCRRECWICLLCERRPNEAGHHVQLSFCTRKETMQNLDKIIIADEVLRRKNAQMDGGLKPEERKWFVQKWYQEHED
jgi:hypothetical protein